MILMLFFVTNVFIVNKVKPYTFDHILQLEYGSIIVCLITIYGGIYSSSEGSYVVSNSAKLFLLCLVIIVNMAYFLYFIVIFYIEILKLVVIKMREEKWRKH
jgi:hypothetical protein